MNLTLDSSALIAYFRKEPGGSDVRDLLCDPGNRILIHASNLCEVYYDLLRDFAESTAEAAVNTVLSLGVILREDLDRDFWKQAGKHKAYMRRISLADCYCLALAQREDAEIVTADHDFDKVADQGLSPVRFIR